jgi:hypothetical protein
LKLHSLSINKFNNPNDVRLKNDKENKYLEISLTDFQIELKADYDLKVATLFKDHSPSSLIGVAFEEVFLGFKFTEEKILVEKFDMKLKEVKIVLNEWLLDLIKRVFMGKIIETINESVSQFKGELEEQINLAVHGKYLIDLGGMGIGVNATVTESPYLEVVDAQRKKAASSLSSLSYAFAEILTESFEAVEDQANEMKFLQKKENQRTSAPRNFNADVKEDLKSFLNFGIRGGIFATIMKDLKPDIPEPAEMKFNQRLEKDDIRILLSDYTINTLLFFVQQSGYISFRITNETNSYLPFNSDIEGLKDIFPKLKEIYPENYPVEIKINCKPSSKQPLMNTQTDGSMLSFDLGFELMVKNSTDIFDMPITEMLLDFEGHLNMQFMFDEDEFLHVTIFRSFVDGVSVKKDNVSENQDELKKDLRGILDLIVDSFRPMFSKVDFGGMFKNATGLTLGYVEFDTRNHHMEFALDIEDI